MVKGKPYVHWKIRDEVDLTEIDPTYLWGTVIESNKGPIDEPVFITNAKQAKSIFNYNMDPFFANGGRYCVIVRAYGTETDNKGVVTNKPETSSFDFSLDKDFEYYYVDYEYYKEEDTYPKATIKVDTSTIDTVRPKVIPKKDQTTEGTVLDVAFYQGRWRVCTGPNTQAVYYPDVVQDGQSTPVEFKIGEQYYSPSASNANKIDDGEILYFNSNDNFKVVTEFDVNNITQNKIIEDSFITKAFNESDVTKNVTVKPQKIDSGTSVIKLETKYPGDFYIPVTVEQGKRQGYRVSIVESDDYTILLSDADTLTYISNRINERAENVVATITKDGAQVEKAIKGENIVMPPIDEENSGDGIIKYLAATDDNKQQYIDLAVEKGYPIGAIFANVAKEDDTVDNSIRKGTKIPYEFKLEQVSTSMADGSNGPWLDDAFRLPPEYRVAAHRDALSYLANIKLAGIFCMYGEDEIQKVYTDHVSTTEPAGMNSKEVCKWRQLIIGCNAIDRERQLTNDIEGQCFNFYDKAIAADNEAITLLAQGLIDTGFVPQAFDAAKEGMPEYQLLPYECTQYIAGLRSGLFYGDSIFGGETKKQIRGIGKLSIAPLFADENKVLWQPDVYAILNQYGLLTFTNEYGQISLTDGVTTRQDPLQEDEEGVVSIVNYAKHMVHETLLKYIGRNITGDLQTGMEVEVRNVLNTMYTVDKTLIDLPEEGYSAFDVEIVLAPKSNAKQILSKVYVFLKITPVHALRQIEVELTVQ